MRFLSGRIAASACPLAPGVFSKEPFDQRGCFGQSGLMDPSSMAAEFGDERLHFFSQKLGIALLIIQFDRFVHFFMSLIRDLSAWGARCIPLID